MSHRIGSVEDINAVLPLMREFYDFEHLPYNESRAVRLLTELVNDERCGRLILIEADETLAGYAIVGFGYSLEFGGRDALLDELFVAPCFRGRGLGTATVEFAVRLCNDLGIEALHLEADHFNSRAHDLYLRLGFKDHARHLMTKWLR